MKNYKGVEMNDDAYKIVTDMEEEMKTLRADMEKMKADMMTGQEDERADAAYVSDLSTKLAKATAQVDALQSQIDTLKLDSAKRLDAAEVTTQVSEWKTAYSEALPYLDSATAIAPSDSVTAIYEKAIAVTSPDLQPKLDAAKDSQGKNYPTYVKAMFDSLPEANAGKRTGERSSGRSNAYNRALARATVGGDRTGESLEHADEGDAAQKRLDARRTYEERCENAWKGGRK